MNRYIIFGLSVALMGAILALNNITEIEINLPFIGPAKTTVAHIFVGAGLVLLAALLILGILEYFNRLSVIAQHREELRNIKEGYENKIDELEYQVDRLKREISILRHKTETTPSEQGSIIDK
ncbi:MAG: hypothetical protein DDT40_00340 [candidate division WS2 bacterium]|nr:hypothetical protein [Candidatus Psychracetigena formicireducens]MBT9137563.1 hypothetical protein [Bacillota bacterium]MBT9150174.1 hypothetical protein [Candidatus Psychracetigena formicireducens]